LRHRLDNYLGLAADDRIAADEGFNFAEQLTGSHASSSTPTSTRRREPTPSAT
jgi:hypothetical protein